MDKYSQIQKKKAAFVIMPIKNKNKGFEEYEHFLALYNRHITPILKEFGYDPVRADEIAHPGSITKEIITRLAESELVIADLTDLNPNVYYELGIRHGLKSKGTILILDELRTPEPPFDLSPYRHIRFKSDAAGLQLLEDGLKKAIKALNSEIRNKSDNPVFDNISVKRLGNHEQMVSNTQSGKKTDVSAEDIIENAILESRSNLVPEKIISEAQFAVSRKQNLDEFLDCWKRFSTLETFLPTEREYAEFYYLSNRINARSKVSKAILEIGLKKYPDSDRLLHSLVGYLASSSEKEDRKRAKEIVQEKLEIKIEDNKVQIIDINRLGESVYLLSLMLDAYHRDREHSKALEITSSLVEKFNSNPVAFRLHARALEMTKSSDFEEIHKYYKMALAMPNVDDVTCRWFASTLRDEDELVNAVEVLLYGSLLDLDEADTFSEIAYTISNIVQPRNAFTDWEDKRVPPPELTHETVLNSILLAESCPNYGVKQRINAESSLRNIGYDSADLEAYEEDKYSGGERSRFERTQFAKELYTVLLSPLTKKTKK